MQSPMRSVADFCKHIILGLTFLLLLTSLIFMVGGVSAFVLRQNISIGNAFNNGITVIGCFIILYTAGTVSKFLMRG